MVSYKTQCPKCFGHNLSITPRIGIGHCFNCHYVHYEGSIRYIPKRRSEYVDEIRYLYKQLALYYHSCLDTKARDYLYKRGFIDTTIQELIIGYCPVGTSPFYRTKIAIEAGIASTKQEAFLHNRIIFPYFKNYSTITDLRGRTLDPDEELRYLSPYNGSYYRGAIYPYGYQWSNENEVIITEGEIKAIISYQSGIPAIALPGITSWRQGFIPEDDQIQIIVLDTESKENSRRDVNAAIDKIASYCTQVKVAVLPLLGKKKAEIDTFVQEHGQLLYRSIIANALPYTYWKRLEGF